MIFIEPPFNVLRLLWEIINMNIIIWQKFALSSLDNCEREKNNTACHWIEIRSIIEITRTIWYVLGSFRFFCDQLPREVWKWCKYELQCLKCSKRYSDWRSLRKHMNYFCQVEPLYPCPYCSHRARIPTLLKYHILREHVGAPVTI